MPSKDSATVEVVGEMDPKDVADYLSEIGATPESLARDAQALREWANAEPHLPNLTSEQDKWLETYLLATKNSMEKAKVRLDNYFSNRAAGAALSDWFHLPPAEVVQTMMGDSDQLLSGIIPRFLPGGYLLIMEKVVVPSDGNWTVDMNLHYRRSTLYMEALLAQAKKIRGVMFVMDQQHITMNVVTTFLASLSGFRRTMAMVQNAMPVRIKSIHLANAVAPNMQRMFLSAITPMLKGKLAQRIMIHADNKSLHEHIPPEYLPKEYGGSAPETMESITASLNDFIMCRKEFYLSRAWMKADEERRLVKKVSSPEFGVEGSFRKLSVD